MKYLLIILLFVSCSDGSGLIGTPIDTTTQTKPEKLPIEPSEAPKPKPLFAFTYGYLEPVNLNKEGDNWETLQNLIDNAEGRIILPAGTYIYSKPLSWTNKTVWIEGQGIGLTVLSGPGIKISRTHSQPRSKISAMSLFGNGEGSGIDISAITDLQDLYIKNYETGVRYVGSIGTNGTDVSGSVCINVEVAECKGDGVFIQGGDANALNFYGCNTRDNGGFGFLDKGFLGSSFFGCMGHNNAKGNFGVGDGTEASNSSRTVLYGCYSEQGVPLSTLGRYTTVYGGTWGSGFKIFNNGVERHGNYLPLEGNQ